MDGTGEHHAKQGQPGSEDLKSYVLPHIWNLDLGQMHSVGGLGSQDKGRAHTGEIGIGRKPKT
jgi:hypothetical protein